jgi:hypothetical protein
MSNPNEAEAFYYCAFVLGGVSAHMFWNEHLARDPAATLVPPSLGARQTQAHVSLGSHSILPPLSLMTTVCFLYLQQVFSSAGRYTSHTSFFFTDVVFNLQSSSVQYIEYTS